MIDISGPAVLAGNPKEEPEKNKTATKAEATSQEAPLR